ncbi:MAG: FMN-binding protein, partial [Elusimicrobia bacterium]|nr:FMN-binding protein [Elusimicrobiota bacterium]
MTRRFQWLLVPAIVLPASQAFAVQYLTITEAQRLLFPSADNFSLKGVNLTDAQAKAVKKMSGVAVQNRAYGVIVAERKGRIVGYLFQDQVLGKHENIDFVLAVDPAGTVLGIEILEYRELYGGEIRQPGWRRQFV